MSFSERDCKIAVIAMLFGAAPFVLGLINGTLVMVSP